MIWNRSREIAALARLDITTSPAVTEFREALRKLTLDNAPYVRPCCMASMIPPYYHMIGCRRGGRPDEQAGLRWKP